MLSLCLSRACLGKTVVYILYKWLRQSCVFLTESIQRGEVGYVGRVRRDLVLESERDLHKNGRLVLRILDVCPEPVLANRSLFIY